MAMFLSPVVFAAKALPPTPMFFSPSRVSVRALYPIPTF